MLHVSVAENRLENLIPIVSKQPIEVKPGRPISTNKYGSPLAILCVVANKDYDIGFDALLSYRVPSYRTAKRLIRTCQEENLLHQLLQQTSLPTIQSSIASVAKQTKDQIRILHVEANKDSR